MKRKLWDWILARMGLKRIVCGPGQVTRIDLTTAGDWAIIKSETITDSRDPVSAERSRDLVGTERLQPVRGRQKVAESVMPLAPGAQVLDKP